MVVLARCGGSQSVLDVPTAMHGVGHPPSAHGDGVTYKVLFSFRGSSGAPEGSLIPMKGLLYGPTYGGARRGDYGTIFVMDTAGLEKVLYSFKGGSDGAYPGGLTKLNGLFFGTTYAGGIMYGWGTVFSLTTAGKERVLYSFRGGSDGKYPDAHLTKLNGVLFGTTSGGGLERCGARTSPTWCGTVFSVTTTGKEDVLYRFRGGKDGSDPNALVPLDGTLYGTTRSGGQYFQGTVFALTP
jgi:uncharacterized repeat protein (TIGR03803 family)